MSAKSKTVMMVAGFGLLAYVVLNMMKTNQNQGRIIMGAPGTAAANRNPNFTLNFPTGNPSTVGAYGGIDLSQYGWLSGGEAQIIDPRTQSVDPAIFDTAGGMSTNSGYYVPTGIGADVAAW